MSNAGGARSRTRKFVLQALYQRQIGGHEVSEIIDQFSEEDGLATADAKYFKQLLRGIASDQDGLDALLAKHCDRPVVQLDPIEHSVLLLGAYELSRSPEIPYRVVIDECVSLTRRFGAQDGHRFVNAVLDSLARSERSAELPGAKR